MACYYDIWNCHAYALISQWKYCASPTCQLNCFVIKHHNNRYGNLSKTDNLVLRMTTTGDKSESSLETFWLHCFDYKLLEIWEWLKISRGLDILDLNNCQLKRHTAFLNYISFLLWQSRNFLGSTLWVLQSCDFFVVLVTYGTWKSVDR